MNNKTYNTIGEAIQQASLRFIQQGIDLARLQAEVLVQYILGWSKAKLLAEMQMDFPSDKQSLFDSWVARREAGEPLQYITGVQEFYGRDFHVNPTVLIPRPETETLIEEVLKRRNWWENDPVITDIGTGSGAIAVTLALEWETAQVYTVDISKEALQTAQENAKWLGADVRFLQGDLVTPLLREQIQPHVLVSNPPYIPTRDIAELMVEVRDHEPRLALDGGEDGLEPYRRITQALPQLMNPNETALVAFEVGIHQAQDVAYLIRQNWPAAETEVIRDLQGIERIVLGWRRL